MALSLEHIQIGWISALAIEALLAEIMLDELIEQAIALPPNDNNIYTYGRIKIAGSNASHVVAIAQLPLSTPGKASAATVANNMRRTFPNLKFGIMVGIAGGVWTTDVDVRLGDIVVGVPDDGGPGIIQYDHGKALQEREFVLKGSLNKAPDLLRSAAGLLKRKHMRKPGEYVSFLNDEEVKRHAPRPDVDNLFSAVYVHQGGKSCEDCDKGHLRNRSHRTDLTPKVHYGAIASGDQVVKDAVFAEKIQRTHNIMCFEMEAAGLDAFPCIVVRGISDYADTHKNDDWHAYAAGTAAAYAKEFLSVVPLTAVAKLPSTGNTHWNVPRAPSPLFTGRQDLLDTMKGHLITENKKKDPSVFVLQGIGGAGKSEAAVKFATENQDSFWGVFWIDADNRQSIEQGFAEIARLQVSSLRGKTPRDVTKGLATTKESWLLILDNCDDAEIDFAEYIPSRGGSIIMTTRLTECRIHGRWENIDDLGLETAVQLLLKASDLRDSDRDELRPIAESVISILGQHALALVHAGAYIKKGYCALDEYVQFFLDEQNQLMEFKLEQQSSRYGSVYTTFEVSAKALASSDRHDSHLALSLLNILAFLDREGVEEEVFVRAFDGCHSLEDECHFVWTENEVQWFQHCAGSSTLKDFGTEFDNELRQLENRASMTDVLCSWRGAHHSTVEVQKLGLIETLSPVQSMSQKRESVQGSVDLMPKPVVLSDIVEERASDCSFRPVIETAKLDGPMYPIDIADPGFCNYVSDGDGAVHHLNIWHCHKLRSSGLVERQKSTRLRAACVRLADLSLVRVENNKISMHPLVHEWALTRLRGAARQNAWEQALSVIALVSYEAKRSRFSVGVMSHVKPCLRNPGDERSKSKVTLGAVLALLELAQLCYDHSRFEDTLTIIETVMILYPSQPHKWSFSSYSLLRVRLLCLKYLDRTEEMRMYVCQLVRPPVQCYEPDSLEAFLPQWLLADYYFMVGHLQDAVVLYESLYERDARIQVLDEMERIGLLEDLCQVHVSLDNHEKAIALLLEKLETYDDAYPRYHAGRLRSLGTLATLYIARGAAEKAVMLLENLVELDSEQQTSRANTPLWVMSTLAQAYEKLHKYDQAIPILEKIRSHDSETLLANDPWRIDTMSRLADAYRQVDRLDQAVVLLEEIVKNEALCLPATGSDRVVKVMAPSPPPNNPKHIRNMTKLAETYIDLQKPDQAVTSLEMVVEAESSSLPLNDACRLENIKSLAMVYHDVEKHSEVVTLLEDLIERLSADDPARLNSIELLADAFLGLKKPSQAAMLLEELADTSSPLDNTERSRIIAALGRAYLESGSAAQAVSTFEKLVESHTSLPSDDMNRLFGMGKLANAYLELGMIAQAIAVLEEVVKCSPADSPYRRVGMDNLAEAYIRRDTPIQAVALLEEVVTSLSADDPARLISMERLAGAYIVLGQPDEAIGLLEEVIKRLAVDDPGRLISMSDLAEAYLDLNKPIQAVSLLEEVFALETSSLPLEDRGRWMSMDRLAEAYTKLNKPIAAIPLLEEVVAMEARLMVEENGSRLFAIRKLAQAYTALGTSEKITEAVSMLEDVMIKGRETLHVASEELGYTQELLANAQDKLRQFARQQPLADSGEEQQSPSGSGEEQGTPDVTAGTLQASILDGYIRGFTRRAALMF